VTSSPLNTTSLNSLIASSQRVAIYASDYAELTNSSQYAMDGCLVDNQLGSGITNEAAAYAWEVETFRQAAARKVTDKKSSKWSLVSLASSVTQNQVEDNAKLEYQPFYHSEITQDCADEFNIQGMTFCPSTLLAVDQLTSYYKQLSLDLAITEDGMDYPNAFYVDAVDEGGTMRTSVDLLPAAATANTKRFAYADSVILMNLFRLCSGGRNPRDTVCQTLQAQLKERRALNPVWRTDDAANGRLSNWPNQTLSDAHKRAGWHIVTEDMPFHKTVGRAFFMKDGNRSLTLPHL